MAYGRRTTMRGTYRKRTSYARGGTSIPRKKKTTRTYVRKNAIVNRRQSRQIRTLFNMRYGPVQRGLQLGNISFHINASQPICFDAADFTSSRISQTGTVSGGCQVWQVNTLTTGITAAGNFTTSTVGNNAYWVYSNKDKIEGGRYKPLYCTYTVEVSGRGLLDSTHIQMDLFAQKAGFEKFAAPSAGMSVYQRFMPDGLVNLTSMCFENSFNPSLFKTYSRKRMLINSQVSLSTDGQGTTTGYQGSTSNVKYFKFTVKPKHARKQLDTFPETPGVVEQEQGASTYGGYGLLNVDPRTPLWCMFSTTDRTSLDGDSVQIRIKRHCVWRDISGGTFTI